MKRKFRVALEGERYSEGPQQTRAISFEAGSGATLQPTLYSYRSDLAVKCATYGRTDAGGRWR